MASTEMYELFRDEALGEPRNNPRYPIYNFFAHDPEGRMIEFQLFTGEVDLSSSNRSRSAFATRC